MRIFAFLVAGACFLEAGLIAAGFITPDWIGDVASRVCLGVFMIVWALGLVR